MKIYTYISLILVATLIAILLFLISKRLDNEKEIIANFYIEELSFDSYGAALASYQEIKENRQNNSIDILKYSFCLNMCYAWNSYKIIANKLDKDRAYRIVKSLHNNIKSFFNLSNIKRGEMKVKRDNILLKEEIDIYSVFEEIDNEYNKLADKIKN